MNIEQAISPFIDGQIGLDVNTFSVDNGGEFIRVRAKVYRDDVSKSKAMEQEWRDTADALIAFLEKQGFGKYELLSVSGTHCQLERVQE